MKFCYFLSAALLSVISAFGQVSKVYITSANKYSDDPVNAVSYILVSRTPDSLYLVKQYDMLDNITMEGAYKDGQLSVQQGEFKFYRLIPTIRKIRLDYTTKKTDTVITPGGNFLYQKGSYTNGKQTGDWLTYDNEGYKTKLNTFRDGKLDGPFKTFGKQGRIGIEGQYVNGKQDEVWYTLTFKGDTSVVDHYNNGTLKKHISRMNDAKLKSRLKEARPPYNLTDFINSRLSLADKNYILNSKGTYGEFIFTLTADGQLTMPIVENSKNQQIDKDIIEAFLNGGRWKPTEVDGKIAESVITIDVALYGREDPDKKIDVFMWRPKVKDYDGY